MQQPTPDSSIRSMYRRRLPVAPGRELGVYDSGRTTVAGPTRGLIHEAFEWQVERAPDAVAACSGGRTLTYAQLDCRANQVAQALLARGVSPEDRVAVYADRGLETIVAMLGTLKAGGAYVPLDPSYPDERLRFMLADSAPVAILTFRPLAGRVSGFDRPVILMDAELPMPVRNTRISGLTPRHLAYVIYTSGSSGVPKGVMIEHRSVLRLVINSSYAAIGPGDCIAHCASPSFDAATWEVWAPLLNGARVLVIPQCVVLNPVELNQTLISNDVTGMWLTVGLFNEYVDALEPAFGRLNYLLTGGDALNPYSVTRALRKPVAPRHLINGYGPTETTTFASTFLITSVPEGARTVPIGRPISDTSIYVLDTDRAPVRIGMEGELYIGGTGVGRGYLNQPGLTAERFIADCFSDPGGTRLYRTGDLGRWLDDVNIEYLGRNDLQVKIRGFRVEPGEVEATLQAHPGVRQAVVVAREDQPGEKRLVGYVVANLQAIDLLPQPDNSEAMLVEYESSAEHARWSLALCLRQYLAATLPAYMVPSSILVLHDLPLTANGKVDRRALPAPELFGRSHAGHVLPRNSSEKMLCQLWEEILDLKQVGIDDNFFELGGTSLTAMKLSSRVMLNASVNLSFSTVLESPTIRTLAEIIEKRLCDQPEKPPKLSKVEHSAPGQSGGPIASETPFEKRAPKRVPLTFQQENFLAFSERYKDWSFWITTELRLIGILNIEALSKSIAALLQRHEALRTRIIESDGVRQQEIDECTQFYLRVVDLSESQSYSGDRDARAYLDSLFNQRIVLAVGPVTKFEVLRLSDREHVLAVAIHHVVSDGVSFVLLFNELWKAYGELVQGRDCSLPTPALQYSDYAIWQRREEWSLRAKHRAYWKAKLDGGELIQMPSDMHLPNGKSGSTAELQISFGEAVSVALFGLAKLERTTLPIATTALYAAMVAQWCKQRDFILPIGFAGRDRPEQFNTMGLFATGLLLRVTLSETDTFADLLRRVNREFLTACEQFDFGRHCDEIPGLERSATIQWVPWSTDELNGVPASPDAIESNSGLTIEGFRTRSLLREDGMPDDFKMESEMLWHFSNVGTCICGRGYYRSDLFTEDYIHRFLTEFQSVAESVVRDPRARLSSRQSGSLGDIRSKRNGGLGLAVNPIRACVSTAPQIRDRLAKAPS